MAAQQQTEVEQLRARVAQLERELAERTERANAAVAAAEDRLYWLDAWKLDLDALMSRPLAQRAYRGYGQLIRAKRLAGRVRRRLTR
jgi:cell division septum initiation protein DivIVA